MKNIILYFFLLFSAMPLFAQSNFFNKKFTKSNVSNIDRVWNTTNDDLLINGNYEDPYKTFIAQIDSKGDISWAKKMQTSAFGVSLNDVTALSGDNILISYFKGPYNAIEKSFIVKMNSTLSNQIWALESSINNIHVTKVKELKNGNIVVLAIDPINTQGNNSTVFTLDSNGKLIWQKSFEFNTKNSGNNLYLYEIEELNDGRLLLVGVLGSGQNTNKENAKLLKLDANQGTTIWQYDYKTSNNSLEYPIFLREDQNGNLYFQLDNYTINTDVYSGMAKIDKNGEPIWRKDYSNQYILGTVTNKPDGTFLASFSDFNTYNYLLNIDTDGNIYKQYVDIIENGSVRPIYDKNSNLTLFKRSTNCDFSIIENQIERRAADGKGTCSFEANLTPIDRKFVKTTIASFSSTANIALGYAKTTVLPLLDLPLATENQPIKCQDTIFSKRCEGDVFTVGNSKYTKDGVYLDVIKKQNCSEVVVNKLSFLKKNDTKLDTALCTNQTIVFNQKTYNKTGVYTDTLKNKLGCDSIITLQIKPKSIQITATDSLQITEGEEATLTATSTTKQVTYEWSPPENLSCEKCPKTIAKPSQSIDYTVKGVSKDGCEAEAKVNIKVFKRGEVFIPTAFSPDDNGTNDVFTVFGNQGVAKILDYSIFDRWGNQIFNQKNVLPNDPISGWDGKYKNEKAQQGVYIYSIKIEMANGKIRDFSGDVLLN